jgi:hypothetical protein
MIEEAPGRGDDDVHAASEHLDLAVDGDTAEDRSETKRRRRRVARERLVHLHRQFPGGDENEPRRHATDRARLAREKALDHRQTECGGLAGAGLRTREEIDAAQHEGNRFGLDRSGSLVAQAYEGDTGRRAEAELRKT